MNLNEHVSEIKSRQDFVSFIRALLKDLKENPNEWENPALEPFLEALAAWTEGLEGYYQNRSEVIPSSPDWRLFGQIMLAAKYYE